MYVKVVYGFRNKSKLKRRLKFELNGNKIIVY